MISASKLSCLLFVSLLFCFCTNKKSEIVSKDDLDVDSLQIKIVENNDSVTGLYQTQPDANSSEDCAISIEITKAKKNYTYLLKTQLRTLKGIARFTQNESGEKYIILEGIKWDDYEGDISREEDNDSVSESKTDTKQLEIPVGIDASYIKDTLTIQNYGNAMNSYTKISECVRKYIQLIKISSRK